MSDRVLTVVQARTGSSRLPGKILLPLGGATVLDIMLGRLARARHAGTLVVATTTAPEDDAIVALAERAGVASFRGHPTDLLDRHVQAARAFGAAHVVKIPSDCPVIDPAAVDAVIAHHLAHPHLAYTSNLHPPTWPDGNDVEIMTRAALETAWAEARETPEREHTTPFIVARPERFAQANVAWDGGRDLSASHRVVLDYREDYDLLVALHDGLLHERPGATALEIATWLDEHPAAHALNARHRGDHWYVREARARELAC